MRTATVIALVALSSCRAGAPEPEAGAATSAPAPRFAPDEELPGPDEVPAFLREPVAGGAAPAIPDVPADAGEIEPAPGPARAPDDLAGLLGQVEVGGEGEDGVEGEAYVAASSGAHEEPDPPPEIAASPDEPDEPPAREPAGGGEAVFRPAKRDPCEPIRVAIQARRSFVGRTAAERDRYGYVENQDDASALRLLESLRRCKEFPDDPDCAAQPLEMDAGDMPQAVERSPDELSADGEDGDAIVHDPEVLRLTRDLAACERRNTPQPLLQR